MCRRHPFAIVIFLAMAAADLRAQNRAPHGQETRTRLNLFVEPERVRFTTLGESFEWRLDISDTQGQPVFETAFVNGRELEWPLVNAQGQAIESGVYHYAVTIRIANANMVRIHRRQLAIERARAIYRISATGDESSDDTALTVVESEPTAGAGQAAVAADAARGGSALRRLAVTFAPQPYISGTGTTGRVTKWSDGPNGVVADTQITEADGNLVVGNGTFPGNVHIFGPANNDLFAGMGPDVLSGPAFNYGYAGASFGRSAGFFNVRPDASAVAPNPSLRFMTANVQRMIVTNTGDVGIGTTSPGVRLHVTGTEGRLRLETTTSNVSSATEYVTPSRTWHAGLGGSVAAGTNDKYYIFDSTAGVVRMVIDGLGRVGVGTTAPTYRLEVVTPTNAVRGTSSTGVGVTGSSMSGNGVEGSSSSGYAGYFIGNVYATGTITQNSDRRLKHDIATLGYGLRDVMQLRPVTWSWNDRSDPGRQLGLIAQDVEAVIPELVTYGKDDLGTLGLNYLGLVPVVVNAIQEQQAAIRALHSENAALRTRLAAIEQMLQAMGGQHRR